MSQGEPTPSTSAPVASTQPPVSGSSTDQPNTTSNERRSNQRNNNNNNSNQNSRRRKRNNSNGNRQRNNPGSSPTHARKENSEGSSDTENDAPSSPASKKQKTTTEQQPGEEVKAEPAVVVAKPPSPPPSPAFNRDDLKCVVCMEYPESQIFQCANGHLLCNGCHQRIVDGEKSVCPSCRVKMSRDQPSRNLFAESVLAHVQVSCSNDGCSEKLAFGKLKEHVEKLCDFRPAVCKYSVLACNWTGIHRDLAGHEEKCEIKNMKGKKLVKLMKDNELKKKSEKQRVVDTQEAQLKIVQLMSSRARDIVIRDVLLEKDDLCDVVCSKTFMALGYAWEVLLNRDRASRKPSLNIRMISMVRRKLNVTFFVLKGPYVELDIPPVIASSEFKKRTGHQSCHIVLQTDEQTSTRIMDSDSLHLRLGFVDKSRGVSRWFTNQNDESQMNGSSDDESDDSDMDMDGEDREHHHHHREGSESESSDSDEYGSFEIEVDSDSGDSVLSFL